MHSGALRTGLNQRESTNAFATKSLGRSRLSIEERLVNRRGGGIDGSIPGEPSRSGVTLVKPIGVSPNPYQVHAPGINATDNALTGRRRTPPLRAARAEQQSESQADRALGTKG